MDGTGSGFFVIGGFHIVSAEIPATATTVLFTYFSTVY
jgi:hypothetical protein